VSCITIQSFNCAVHYYSRLCRKCDKAERSLLLR